MKGLESKNSTFILIPNSYNIESIYSVLFSMNYNLVDMRYINEGIEYKSIMGYNSNDNNDLRKDVIFILNEFNMNYSYIKYKNENKVKKLFKNGSERLTILESYNIDNINSNYFIHNYDMFYFKDVPRYRIPSKQSDFKPGMIIEYLNNHNNWTEKLVQDPLNEYNNMYKLLIKYNKVRILQD